jgi:hypothetical protein
MHHTKAEIEDLKSRVDLVALVQDTGVLLKAQGRNYAGRCPLQTSDRTPSFVVNPLTQLYSCFGACRGEAQGKSGLDGQYGGDCFTYVMKRFGMTFQQAFEYLRERYGTAPKRTLPKRRAETELPPSYFKLTAKPAQDLRIRCVDRHHLELSQAPRAQEWVESRGLVTKEVLRAHRVGYSSGSLEDICGTQAGDARALLQEIGYLDEDGKETMKGRVVFPLLALNKLPISVYGHAIRPGHLPKHRVLKGDERGLFNLPAPRVSGEVVLVESVLCALSAAEAGHLNFMPTMGARAPSEELITHLKRCGVRSVVVGMDADEAGRAATPGILEQLAKEGFAVRSVQWPEKDPNDVLVRYGPKKTKRIFDKLLRPVRACDLPAKGNGDQAPAQASMASMETIVATLADPATGAEPAASTDPAPEGAPETHVSASAITLVDLATLTAELAGARASLNGHEVVSISTPLTERLPLFDLASLQPVASLDEAPIAMPIAETSAEPSVVRPNETEIASIREGVVGAGSEGPPEASAEGPAKAAPEAGFPVVSSDPVSDSPSLSTSPATPEVLTTTSAPMPTSASVAAPPSPPPRPALTSDELRAETLTVRFEDRRFGVSWLPNPSPAHLRATVRLELLPEAADEGATPLLRHIDTLNLLASRNRDAFCRRAIGLISPEARTLLPGKEALERLLQQDLMTLYDLGEERRRVLADAPKVVILTEERRAKGIAYLIAECLLERLAEDLDAMGYVGERKAKILGYFVSISRKLPEALSMVILSSSGSGKSALAELLERLTPEEDLLVVTRLTASSLYWMPKDALKRKFISIEERTGSEEADYALRALQSKGKVSQMVPIKDQATGKIESQHVMSEGPASTLESTTEHEIFFENATRCFEQRLDESPEQTRRIQEAQRFSKTPAGKRAKERGEELAVFHRDVQRCLRVVSVAIPWAHLLTFPSTWTRNRRDNLRFLNLIEVIAFLLQYQRPLRQKATDEPCAKKLVDLTDEELRGVYVEAQVEDYAAARALYADILLDSMAELKKPLRVLYDACVEMEAELVAEGEEDFVLMARQIRERTLLPQHQVKRGLLELVDLEYLAITRGKNGTANGYRVIDLPRRVALRMEGLLTPEELAKRIEDWNERRRRGEAS